MPEPIDLNKRKEANAVAMSLGRWGMAWILQVCAEVYDEMAYAAVLEGNEDVESEARFRARFLREIKRSFE